MKYLMILTVGVCLLLAAVPVMAQSAADEAAIRAATKQAIETMNEGDIKSHADVYADPFEVFTGTTDRPTHEKNHKESMARSKDAPATQKMLEEIGVVFLSADIAIHKCRVQWTGGIDQDGKAMPPEKQYVARIYMKQNGKWLNRAVFTRTIDE